MMEERYYDYMVRKLIETNDIGEGMTLPSFEDMVNHPPHYNNAGIETIDAIEAMTDKGFEYYLQGNIMKYLWRYRYKTGVEYLRKAEWYLNKLIKNREDYEKSLG